MPPTPRTPQPATTGASPQPTTSVAPVAPSPSASSQAAISNRVGGQVAAQGAAPAGPPQPSAADVMKNQIRQGAGAYLDTVIAGLRAEYTGKLSADLQKKLMAKLPAMQAVAKGQVETDLAGAGGSAQELADVNANSAALANASGAAAGAIGEQAREFSKEALDGRDVSGAKGIGENVFTTAVVNPAKGFAKENARIQAAAKQAMEPLVKQQFQEAIATANTTLLARGYDARLVAAVKTKTTEDGDHVDELARRHGDNQVGTIALASANTAVAGTKAKLKAYLEDKLGAHGAGFTRSSELREFRGKLKTGAREQAHVDIDADMASASPTAGGGAAMKDYKRMVARNESYDSAKTVVDDHLTTLAQDGVDLFFTPAETPEREKLTAIASTAAWGVMRSAKDPVQGNLAGQKAANKAVEPETKLFLKRLTDQAHIWKDQILKKPAQAPAPGAAPQAAAGKDAATETAAVKGKVTNPRTGENVAKKALTAANGEEALGMLGTVIDLAAPQVDTSCALEIAFKVPVGYGGFLEFAIKGEAAREESGTKIAAALKLGAGWETYGFAAAAHMEIFLEAMSGSTRDAVLLLQYGVYRRLADKNPAIAGVFAGKRLSEARTDMGRAEQNERWAAMVEERALTGDDHFVHSGMGADLGVKADAGLVKGDASVAHRAGTKIDKSTLGAGLGALPIDKTASRDDRDATAMTTAGTKKQGVGTKKTTFAINGEFNAVDTMKFAFGGQLVKETVEVPGTPAPEPKVSYDGEVSFKVPFDLGGVAPPTLANTIAGNFVPSALSMFKSGYEAIKHKPDTKTKGTAIAADVGEDAVAGIDAALALARGDISSGIMGHMAASTPFGDLNPANFKSDYVNDTLAKGMGTEYASSSTNALNGTSALEVVVGLKYDGTHWLPRVAFSQTKKMELNIGGFGAGMKVSVERKKKLAGLERAAPGATPPVVAPVTP